MDDTKKRIVVGTIGATTVGLAAGTYYLWCRRHDLQGRFKTWKKEKIADAYYASLTQEDVAWG